MKKLTLLSFLLVFLFLSFNSAEASELNLKAGISYNTYQLDELDGFAKARGGKAIDSGMGFNLGLEKEVYNNMIMGIECEYMSVSYDDLEGNKDVRASNTGLLLTGAYKFSDNLRLNAAVGQYIVNVDYHKNDDRAYRLGAKFGGAGKIEIKDNVDIVTKGGYRVARVGDYDFSGLEISFLTKIKF